MGIFLSGCLQYSAPKKEINKVQGNLIKKITLTLFYKVFLKAFQITLELAPEIAS